MTARGAALAAAALLAVAAGCASPEARLEKANELRRRGQPREALAAYQALLGELGEAPLPGGPAAVRLRALRAAGDVAYLELGDYAGAIAYYRRMISLHPGSPEAVDARATIGDILKERFHDPVAAIAQWADVGRGDGPRAAAFQLRVAREYLDLGNTEQARTEARHLRERWPESPEGDEAQLITAQAWALERREEEAASAFAALLERRPRPELQARALEGQAHLHAQAGRYDRALELYAAALPMHPNPDAIKTNMEAVERRREAARTAKPGDRAEAFDYGKRPAPAREVTP